MCLTKVTKKYPLNRPQRSRVLWKVFRKGLKALTFTRSGERAYTPLPPIDIQYAEDVEYTSTKGHIQSDEYIGGVHDTYRAGFHCLRSEADARKYAKCQANFPFTIRRVRVRQVVAVGTQNMPSWDKRTTVAVVVARKMTILPRRKR